MKLELNCRTMDLQLFDIVGIFCLLLMRANCQFSTDSCWTLAPANLTGQHEDAPVLLWHTVSMYQPGQTIPVLLTLTGGTNIRNAIFQVRKVMGDDASPVGSFILPANFQYLTCGTSAAGTVASNRLDTRQIQLEWTAPTSAVGDVVFKISYIDGNGTLWQEATSSSLMARNELILTCPTDIAIPATKFNGEHVDFNPLYCTDPTSAEAITTVTCTPPEGFFFIGNKQQVACICRDQNGASNTCSFFVTVQDTQPPALTCPTSGVVFEILSGDPGALVSWDVPVPTDNDGIIPLLSSTENPDTVVETPGSYAVTYTAVDSAGNEASCSFIYTVVATEDPVIECPSDINAVADSRPTASPDSDGAYVSFAPASCTDNSGIFTVSCVPDPSSFFPVTTTHVRCVCVDGFGGSAACKFNVTVTHSSDSPNQLALWIGLPTGLLLSLMVMVVIVLTVKYWRNKMERPDADVPPPNADNDEEYMVVGADEPQPPA